MSSVKSAAKAERLFNLVIALLNTERFRDVGWIRDKVDGYQGATSDDAFFRMFERDKTELRDLGIPLQTSADGAYRIVRGEFELPAMTFTPGERAALALAGRLWETTVLGDAGREALRKLGDASGDQLDASLTELRPRVRTPDAAFQPLYTAVQRRSPVTFDYRKGNTLTVETRRVQPWGLVSWRGRWYLVGHDVERDHQRTFRLSRIVGDVVVGRPGRFTVPDGIDLLRFVKRSGPAAEWRTAVVSLVAGAGAGLRRGGVLLDSANGVDRVQIHVRHVHDTARLVAALGPDALVESPPELRAAVVRVLTEAAGEPDGPGRPAEPRFDLDEVG